MGEDITGFIIPMEVSLNRQFNAINFVNKLLRQGFTIFWANKQFKAKTEIFPGGYMYSAGDFIVPLNQAMPFDSLESETFVQKLIKEFSEDLDVIVHEVREEIRVEAYQLSMPRIGVYSGPGTFDCYLWFHQCLEKLGFYADCLSAYDVKDGKLKSYDVLVQPGGDETIQSEALWPEGREEIRKFLINGGNYLGSCGGFDIAGYADGTPLRSPHTGKIKHLNLVEYEPTRNVPRSDFPHDEWARLHYLHLDFNEYSQLVPVKWGTLIPIRIRQFDSPITFGYQDIILPGLYYAAGPLPKKLGANVISVAEFAADLLPLDSPWTLPPEYAVNLLQGATAIATAKYGAGKLVLFAPHPEAPGCEAHFRLVANAVYFLTAKGPFEIEVVKQRKKFSHQDKLPCEEKTQTNFETALGRSFRAIAELKHEFDEFKLTWFEVNQKNVEWSYDFVPEWILKLPGYSRISMPELEIKVLEGKLFELPCIIYELSLNHQRLSDLNQKLMNISGEEASAFQTLIINSINKVSNALEIVVEIASLKGLIGEASQRLQCLKPKLCKILRTRAEIEELKQPPSVEDKLLELWRKLDIQQYEFDFEIWAGVLLGIDGKSEVPIFSEWKEGIIEKRSRGVIPELIKLTAMAKEALENSSYAIAVTNHFLNRTVEHSTSL
jgi:hypothetical protein